jgi:hypothetical protein
MAQDRKPKVLDGTMFGALEDLGSSRDVLGSSTDYWVA